MKTEILKFYNLVGTFYKSNIVSKDLIIVAIGIPNLKDVDNLRNVDILNMYGYDVFVPDYYWFCRSGWKFSPKSCINTLIDSKKYFSWSNWINVSSWEEKFYKYWRISFLGLSFWWSLVSVLPRFDKSINEIWLFYPALEFSNLWKIWKPEESVDDFYNVIDRWYTNLYNWIKSKSFKDYFRDLTLFTPIKNIKYLNNTSVFIAHWTEDESINYSRSKDFYNKLKTLNNSWDFIYKEYKWTWHSWVTMKYASHEFMHFLDERKQINKN